MRMSSGASVAYEKPRSGTVELHRRDAEVEQDRVGLDAVRRELLEHERELAAQQARLQAPVARRLKLSKYGWTVGSRSIAM